MAGPWEKYGGTSAPATSQPPAVIYGEVDPFKVSGEARAERSAERQDAAALRAADASDRAAAAAERAAANDERKAAADARKLAAGGGIEATESERTAAFLATRVANGLDTLKGIGAGGDATLGTRVAEALPFGLGNYAVSGDRQRTATAQLDVLDAALTLGTGAAYTKEQLEGYRQSYFPQPGDQPDVVADKEARLKVLLEAARVKAGAAAPAIDRALQNAAVGENLVPTSTQAPSAAGDANTLTSAVRRADGQFDLTWGDGRKQVADSIPFDSTVTADSVEPTDANRDTVLGAVDATVRGVADTVTLGFADEIAAGAGSLATTGDFSDYESLLGRERRLDAQDERVNPYARLGGQVAGGFILPTGGATGARGLAKVGTIYGTGYGIGSAGDSAYERLVGGIKGGATGGIVGGSLGALGSRLGASSGGGGPTGGSASELAQAAQQEGVRVSRPIVDPSSRARMAYLESSIGGGGRVRQGLEETRAGLENRVGEIGGPGTVQDPGIIGQRVQDAAIASDRASRNAARRDYTRAAQEAPNAQVVATDAVAAIDGHISRLAGNENTNSPMIDFLNKVKADFVNADGTPRAKSIDEIRDLRTSLNDEISRTNLSHTRAEALVEDVVNAASGDIQRELSQQSPRALALWKQGDAKWAQYKTDQKQLTSLVLGRADDPISGEAVYNRLRTMASQKGDADKIQRLFDKLPADVQQDYTATIAQSLGRRAADEPFSPALLIQAARGFSDEAARTIFGPDGAQSIKNLKMLARAYQDTTSSLNNSRSGAVLNYANFFRNIAGGGVLGTIAGGPVGGATGLALGATSAAVGAGARNLSAKALMNPDMTKWLAAAPRASTTGAINRHIARLETVARKNPTIAQDVGHLKDALLQSINGADRAVAQENTQAQR